MSETIWKATIRPNSIKGEVYEIRVPARQDAYALSVGIQDGKVVVWFEVDPSAPDNDMLLYSVGTGFGKVPVCCRFIGTVMEGSFVWHIYAAS
jgi:hypothetical protein